MILLLRFEIALARIPLPALNLIKFYSKSTPVTVMEFCVLYPQMLEIISNVAGSKSTLPISFIKLHIFLYMENIGSLMSISHFVF